MKRKSVFSYFAFGYDYRILRFNWAARKVEDGISMLSGHLEDIQSLGLPVSASISQGLSDCLGQLKKLELSSTVPPALATEIENILEKADPAIDAEMQQLNVLVTTPKRFDVERLMREPEKLLSEGTWDQLSEQARRDYRNACMCVALSIATAAAFHTLRSVEEMVKQLYYSYVKTKRMSVPMWGPITQKLREKKKPRPPIDMLDHLDSIRRNFRNPTQHPEKFYTIDEAQDLLFSCIVALNQICADMKVRDNKATDRDKES